MKTLASRDGSDLPLPKQTIRLCSRNRPTMLFTRMFSDSPGTPGLRQQMPRTIRSMATPACERSEEHTSELQSLMRISYAVFCLKKKTHTKTKNRSYAKNERQERTRTHR